MNKRFWMVWNPNGRAPTYQHFTEAEALQEAERLTTTYGATSGDVFYVLEAKHMVKLANRPVERLELANEPFTDEERSKLKHKDEIPF